MSTHKSTESLTLDTGDKIPAIGLGTWRAKENEGSESVLAALKAGYTHIDTLSAYQNEEEVGKAIALSGIPRDQLFVTTKLACTHHGDPEKALQDSLDRLGLEYVDLYLMHWPVYLNPNGNDPFLPLNDKGERDVVKDWDFIKSYKLLEKCKESGKLKNIGVSNFSVKNLKKLLASDLKYKPAANQVESHPYLPQHELLKFCKENDIVFELYSPLGSIDSPLFTDETLSLIAAKYGVSTATVMISWQVWRGCVVLPKSVKPLRIEQNIQIITLDDHDGKTIDALSEKLGGTKRFINPQWGSGVVVYNDDI